MKNIIKSKIFRSLSIFLFGTLILQFFLELLVDESNIILYSFGLVFNYVLLVALLYFIYKDEINKMFIDFKENFSKYLRSSLVIYLIGFAVMLGINYLLQYHIFDEKSLSFNESAVRGLINTYFVAYFFIVVLLAPILEELVFRFGFDIIKNKYSFIIISSIAFALLHSLGDFTSLIEALNILPYLAVGIAFGYIYYETKNVFPGIVLHLLHNLIAFIILWIG